MFESMKGKVALVTGASSGIGRSIAETFARYGCKVVVADIDRPGGEQTVFLIKASQGEAILFPADVTSECQVKALMEFTVHHYGGLDFGINNAGIEAPFLSITETELSQWQRVIDVNLTGVFLCMKHEINVMKANRGGSIVNISSMAAKKPLPGTHGYSASKRGILSLTEITAVEWAKHDIRINAILPGFIESKMLATSREENPALYENVLSQVPTGTVGSTANIADAVVWLCSDSAHYITGAALPVDGGVTL